VKICASVIERERESKETDSVCVFRKRYREGQIVGEKDCLSVR